MVESVTEDDKMNANKGSQQVSSDEGEFRNEILENGQSPAENQQNDESNKNVSEEKQKVPHVSLEATVESPEPAAKIDELSKENTQEINLRQSAMTTATQQAEDVQNIYDADSQIDVSLRESN